MSDIDPTRYLLSEADSKLIFQSRIVPSELLRAPSQRDPVVVFVAGQPGAGKTRTTEAVKNHLDQRGGAAVVNSDFYKPFHPEYSRLLAEDDRNAAPYTSMDGRRWMAMAEEHLIGKRADVIIETTMRDPGDFAEPAAMFRAQGYRVEAAIMAVPEALSRLGIVHRYHDQVQELGHGRLTAQSNHDASYHGVAAAARAIDQDRIVDAATVYRRGNQELITNQLTDGGNWRWPDRSIARTIDIERNRPWTAEETSAFTRTLAKLGREMGPAWHDELASIGKLALPFATPEKGAAPATGLPGPQATPAAPRRSVQSAPTRPLKGDDQSR
ncbi:putative zeta toxin [Actinoplanes missouriensis 431]|uniref:UDP-N-acetylglucosamine kinase n=1 Tax=Actinoplanes missouriensis (strain ATCC 14538 / DSM 43046 / CBS 188.64 / JCM 3121 / NBRC 102363 / NCIMB 12654 / NRRL B-3342 / UNCC 431) TaxID=512565 RepID=I0H0G8_ACTM4|nr:zeta toxin family protein [Actinoplanes missouriensis]BAL86505.1 putative zeta toxin [Actinoplanes missouriensis 431]